MPSKKAVKQVPVKKEATTQPVPIQAPQGWGWPETATKAHYFTDGLSLCKRWIYMKQVLEDDNHESEDNCVMCKEEKLAQLGPKYRLVNPDYEPEEATV